MPAKQKLEKLIFDYFLDEVDEESAKSNAVKFTSEIIELMNEIDIEIKKENSHTLSPLIHTLKHLLLYADLDYISDMCHDFEDDLRIGITNNSLKEKIFQEIVK